MGIAWSGATQSGGAPKTFYWYEAEYSNRTATTVHVKLKLWVRMNTYSSYFSFQIAHETKVYKVSDDSVIEEAYQWAWIKQGRGWWGHQWEGDSWLWTAGTWDYNGSNWHGPYTVFDKDVPIGIDDETINIVPVITRPPCLYDPSSFDGSYTPWLDKTNWKGYSGYWRPWSKTEYPWYFWHYDHSCSEDMAFGNNRWLEPLGGGTNIGRYVRISDVGVIRANPQRIDVSLQDSQEVTVSWDAVSGASYYKVTIVDEGTGEVINTVSDSYRQTSITFNPKRYFVGGNNWKSTELFDGTKVHVYVQSFDNQGISSASSTAAPEISYYEVASEAPTDAFIIGRNGRKNECMFRGERLNFYYDGSKDGSYKIAKYVLHRVKDKVEVSWEPPKDSSGKDSRSRDINGRFVTIDFPSWAKPNEDIVFELRAYNSKGRPVYMSGTSSWFRFSVHYYGGILYVWGKPEYTGNDTAYDRLSGESAWREGLCRVWDGSEWRESEVVYVWDGYWRGM